MGQCRQMGGDPLLRTQESRSGSFPTCSDNASDGNGSALRKDTRERECHFFDSADFCAGALTPALFTRFSN